jgi:hypothetical protein
MSFSLSGFFLHVVFIGSGLFDIFCLLALSKRITNTAGKLTDDSLRDPKQD